MRHVHTHKNRGIARKLLVAQNARRDICTVPGTAIYISFSAKFMRTCTHRTPCATRARVSLNIYLKLCNIYKTAPQEATSGHHVMLSGRRSGFRRKRGVACMRTCLCGVLCVMGAGVSLYHMYEVCSPDGLLAIQPTKRWACQSDRSGRQRGTRSTRPCATSTRTRTRATFTFPHTLRKNQAQKCDTRVCVCVCTRWWTADNVYRFGQDIEILNG